MEQVLSVDIPNKVLTTQFGRVVHRDPLWVRAGLIGTALAFLFVLVFLPLVVVFVQAMAKGIGVYWRAITEPDAIAAIRLTLLISFAAVSVNLAFGLAAGFSL